MELEHPWALAIAVAAVLPMLRVSMGARNLPRLTVREDVRRAGAAWVAKLLWLPSVLLSAALAASALATAGLHQGVGTLADRTSARDIVLAVDVSESMSAVDYHLSGRRVSRLEAARQFAAGFIERRKGDRVGIVAFGGRAVTQCPLTFDRRIARALLGYVEPEMLGARTALGDAVALAAARMEQGGAVVLLTDGRETAGNISVREAAHAAAAEDVKVYAVGIGSGGPAPVPVRLPSGRVRLQQKDYRLDEASLTMLANTTGGRYFRAADSAALDEVFAEIDRLEARLVPDSRRIALNRRCAVFGALAAGCLAALLLLSATLLRTTPVLR